MAPTAVDLLLTKIPNASEIKEFISNNGADEKMLDEWLFERIYKGVDYKEMEKQQITEAQMDMFYKNNNIPFGMHYLIKRDEALKYTEQYYTQTYKSE